MDILDFTKRVESFSKLYKIDEESDVNPNYTDSRKLEKELTAHNEEIKQERILKIGVIGRVKAGKSSLLNMLFFGGRDVLPKAATPMTAALTCLRYGETCRAEIDCFTPEDISEIKQNAKKYEDFLKKEIQDQISTLKERNKAVRKVLDDNEILRRAEKNAEKELKDHFYLGAYEQAILLNKSGEMPQVTQLEANTPDALMSELQHYVGADGKYMPYTKSVILYLPEEGLKGIEIIDTPGVNDPVKSREERTNQFLKNCNVVLTVSPTSQFLDESDCNFIEGAMTASGVQECYLIGSRFDDTLIESAVSESISDPLLLIEQVTSSLKERAHEVLNQRNVKFNEFVGSSSIAFTLLQYFDEKNKWDELGQTVWYNLSDSFPSIFNSSEKAKEVLAALTGKTKINQIIDTINQNKQATLDKADRTFNDKYKHQLRNYLSAIEKWTEIQLSELDSANEEQLLRRKAMLERISKDIENNVNETFTHSVEDFSSQLEEALSNKNRDIFKGFDADEGRGTDTETEYYTESVRRERSGFLNGVKRLFRSSSGYYYEDVERSRTKIVKVVRTAPICDAIDEMRERIEEQLSYLASSIKSGWQDSVVDVVGSRLYGKLNTNAEVKQYLPKQRVIEELLNKSISKLPEMMFKLDAKPSDFERRVTLDESDGNSFIRKSEEYMNNLQKSVSNMITNYVENYRKTLINQRLGNRLTTDLTRRLNKTLSDLNDIEVNTKLYNSINCEVKKLKSEIVIN